MTTRIKATPSAVDAVRRETVEECAKVIEGALFNVGKGHLEPILQDIMRSVRKQMVEALRALASSGEGVDGGEQNG